MKKHTLKAESRKVVGRKTKNLRKQGILPATIYGKKVKSINIQIPLDAFEALYKETGETGLIELSLGTDSRPVLVHTIQKDPVSDKLLHVEFLQVDLKEKVKTHVPLEFVGESPAVGQKIGVLLRLLDEVEVEALPTDLPEKISIDVSGLAGVDQELKVADLKAPQGVTILTEGAVGVVKVGPLVSKEAEAEAKAAEAAATEAAAAAAAAAPSTEAQPAGEPSQEAPQPTAPEKKEEKK